MGQNGLRATLLAPSIPKHLGPAICFTGRGYKSLLTVLCRPSTYIVNLSVGAPDRSPVRSRSPCQASEQTAPPSPPLRSSRLPDKLCHVIIDQEAAQASSVNHMALFDASQPFRPLHQVHCLLIDTSLAPSNIPACCRMTQPASRPPSVHFFFNFLIFLKSVFGEFSLFSPFCKHRDSDVWHAGFWDYKRCGQRYCSRTRLGSTAHHMTIMLRMSCLCS